MDRDRQMTLLNDQDLAALISGTPPLVTDIDPHDAGRIDSRIQPASVDLTVGDIFLPKAKPGESGSLGSPKEELTLEQGHTAVLRTHETLNIPANIGAIGFPPSNVSLRGLLMTNPGHIDPGYIGPMHFTVINMGRTPYPLQRGDPIVSVMFFTLTASAQTPYNQLSRPSSRPTSSLSQDLLERLSSDFMDIDDRAGKKAKEAVRNATIFATIISSAIIGTIALIGTIWSPWSSPIQDVQQRLSKMEGRLGSLGGQITLDSVEKRLSNIEKKLGTRPE